SSARAEAILAAAGVDTASLPLGAPVPAGGGDPGAMAAVSATPEQVTAALGELGATVVVANHNAPAQAVVSGPTAAVTEALGVLKAAGLAGKKIPVACAFHSPLLAGAVDALAAALDTVEVTAPTGRVWSNTTAGPYPTGPDEVKALFAGQVGAPVRWVDQVENMYAAGVRTFVETGPGTVLTGLVGKILAGRPHTALALDRPRHPGLPGLLRTLAQLAALGHTLDTSALFTGRGCRTATVKTTPRRPGWTLDGAFVRTADGHPLPGALQPATDAPALPTPGTEVA
nr:acyltransferase domain-containing protein [Micromonospora sp. DSM 115978]